MGIVYLALAQGPGGFTKLKVVKRLRPDIADDPRARQMFLDEAKLAARLLHPNIVQTNEVGFDGKHYFLEMEYLEGQSLHALMRRAGFAHVVVPLDVTLWILAQALAGLHHAHELRDLDGAPLSVVHRDVSPHNVLITYDGNVKVLDFGIAKAADSRDETATGAVKGKITYMSPEQAARRPADRRADIFAAGVILWEALAGKRLWSDLGDLEILVKLQEGVPSPLTARADLDPDLVAICLRAVAPNPDERFATAAEMQAALEDHLEAKGTRVGPRAVAKLMDDLFGGVRLQMKGEIEARIKDPASQARTFEIPAIVDMMRDGTETRQRNRALRRWIFVAAAVAILAAGATVFVALGRKPSTGGASASAGAAASHGECASNVECSRAHGGAAFVCRKPEGKCVALESEDCKLLAEPGAADDDRTLWFGTMFPTTGPNAQVGTIVERGVDLGRRDFAQITHGLPSTATSAAPHPLSLVACNDTTDALRAARHLADVGVPAVIGFSSSQEVIDVATQVFIPRRILVVASENQSPLITTIPHPKDTPRLVFRTTLSAAYYQIPVSLVVPEVIEPRLRATPVLAKDGSMRVALVRPSSTAALSIADRVFANLHFNGKSALDNGNLYRQFVVNDLAHGEETVKALLDFRPHVVIFAGGELAGPVFEPLEAAWKDDVGYRPTFVATGSLIGDELFRFIGKDGERRRRFFGVAPPSTTMANARLTMRYNEVFGAQISPSSSPAASYDAFYLLAYAAFASGAESPTGEQLAAAISKLVPPGTPIDVGPTHILEGVDALRSAGRFDLSGIMTTLDFDAATGETRGDLVITCVGAADDGAPYEVDSGLRYDAASGKLVGALRCP